VLRSGGGEYGAEWHRTGRQRLKHHSISDVLHTAQWLCGAGYTQPHLMCAYTASAGALAIAAAINHNPKLFQAAVMKGQALPSPPPLCLSTTMADFRFACVLFCVLCSAICGSAE
jgi:hypothetical protein